MFVYVTRDTFQVEDHTRNMVNYMLASALGSLEAIQMYYPISMSMLPVHRVSTDSDNTKGNVCVMSCVHQICMLFVLCRMMVMLFSGHA